MEPQWIVVLLLLRFPSLVLRWLWDSVTTTRLTTPRECHQWLMWEPSLACSRLHGWKDLVVVVVGHCLVAVVVVGMTMSVVVVAVAMLHSIDRAGGLGIWLF